MNTRRLSIPILLLAVQSATCIAVGNETASLRLPAIFGDNMALQSAMAVPVWGWDRPGQRVTVRIAGQEKSALTDADGKWRLKLDPLATGTKTEMTVEGSGTVTFTNVIVGEVWIGAGQSNMNFGMGGATDGLQELRRANYPSLRIFAVPMHCAPDKEREDIGEPWGCFRGQWLECSPATIGAFSGVAYFFGREIHRELDVPVGLIVTVWGGVGIESFFSWDMLRDHPVCQPVLEKAEQWMKEKYPEAQATHAAAMAAYETAKALPVEVQDDKGWEAPGFDDSSWDIVTLPKNGLSINGVAWHRRTIRLPDGWKGRGLLMKAGVIVDIDTTYVNGTKLGQTDGWTVPREYDIPAQLTEAGTITIAIRVQSLGGWNAIRGNPEEFEVSPVGLAGATPIALAGDWRRRVTQNRPVMPQAAGQHCNPASVFNGMVAPLIPYGIRGFLWYQGESGGHAYAETFPILIRSYRKKWGQGDFPFPFVQLPNLDAGGQQNVEDSWISVREAQLKALSVTNTGMAVTIDVGDPEDVHCRNKEPVGRRLALWALARVYGRDIVYSGPLYRSMKIEGNRIRLLFDFVGGGLLAKGGDALKTFVIAGEDRVFVPAQARIEGDSVMVWNDGVAHPLAVRYAWACNPEGCNLYNQEGLPASPFRTDDWPMRDP